MTGKYIIRNDDSGFEYLDQTSHEDSKICLMAGKYIIRNDDSGFEYLDQTSHEDSKIV